MRRPFPLFVRLLLSCLVFVPIPDLHAAEQDSVTWNELPPLPDELGVAGPFAGVHRNALIVAGGANFPQPVWDNDKVWRNDIHVLTRRGDRYEWRTGGALPRPIAYGAAVSTPDGIVCIGGNDAESTFDSVFLMSWNPNSGSVEITDYPALPKPCAFMAAALLDNVIYVAGGQSDSSLESATTNLWTLDLTKRQSPEQFRWEAQPPCPGPSRAFNLTVAQHNGYDSCIYVMSGRRQEGETVEFLRDVWEFHPSRKTWRKRANSPRCMMAGTAIAVGQSHVWIPGGATETLFGKAEELRDDHPGFIKKSLWYHTITDTWVEGASIPANHVTTIAVQWGDDIIIPSGEIRPRVRSPKIWKVSTIAKSHDFGLVNYVVLFSYLLLMVGVGLYFARKNRNTDDYFRGGKQIPWWAAGCSIFATMLSSLTFTGLPSKAYAQDWVYAVGNFMIPVVGILAVYFALPFFRRIDATSAYEYLEKRFSRSVRLFGSASFTLFHVFRMAVVMSLTGYALAIATPLTPTESVLLMGVLSIAYCTMGGIEAVIWTDTLQTVVLLGGALLAFGLLLSGIGGGWTGFVSSGSEAGKFSIANWHWDATQSQIALWVIVVGSIGQNFSSYTADQAVVQRYMTTENESLAARSIWMGALLAIPATLLFFGIGSALFAFYQAHPDKLNPTITTDQIFPLFIAREMPIGLAGLIVAGVFAAAQSTVSTSMNSTATSIVTDFMRPFGLCKSEAGYFRAARICTLLTGVLGTMIALIFVDPDIKSLFDEFIKVIGLFMGVLGGLFLLGAATTRTNAGGAMAGAITGAGVMFCLWRFSSVNGYLYTTCGIATCVTVGYICSFLFETNSRDLTGLTIYSMPADAPAESFTPLQSGAEPQR